MSLSPAPDPQIPVFAASLGSWRISLGRAPLAARDLSERYDAEAGRWDAAVARHGMPGAYGAVMRGALAGWQGPIRAIDCGIGTGALSLALQDAAPGPIALDGVDISPEMLRRAAARLRGAGIVLRGHSADLRALPHAAGSFDIAMTAHAIEHLPDPRLALREMVRVTRPGGRVVICATRASPMGLLIQLRWRTHRIAPARLAGWMRECGLSQVRRLASGARRFDALSSAWVGTVPHAPR